MDTYRGLLNGGEHTSGLHNIIGTSVTPFDVSRVSPVKEEECLVLRVSAFAKLFIMILCSWKEGFLTHGRRWSCVHQWQACLPQPWPHHGSGRGWSHTWTCRPRGTKGVSEKISNKMPINNNYVKEKYKTTEGNNVPPTPKAFNTRSMSICIKHCWVQNLIQVPLTPIHFIYHVVQVNEWVIDGHNFHLLGSESSTGHQTTNAAKSARIMKSSFWVWPLDGNLIPVKSA